ncbi:phage tail tape measure protein [Kutzneria buriramensis]|uniref:TP901 family phage tail tape measure protein n=1 Tax=Kutzneria buriramensis TaxID=1045776 RepID=A0A3E0HEL2_9PSEU|nr:phage tail tape measure protein [Kutzneria buriramensis]REH43650.1 TP901 family phage tail tape measure protein [Kutzneria buriramensis]
MGIEKVGVEVTGVIGGLATAMQGAIGWIKKVEKANTDGASSAQKAAAVGGAALAVVGGAAVAAGVKFVGMAADFESSQTRLATSAGESKDNLQMVGDGVLKLAGDVGDSTKELEAGMYTVESAGFHGKAGLDVLKSAAEGAKAENADLATVANAVTSGLNAYGVQADQAGRKSVEMTNQMIAAVGAGKMTMEDLSGSLSAVLPTAAAAKLSFDQVGGAIATMTAQGMSAQQSAQDLNNTIGALQAPNQQAIKEMAQLGLNSNDVAQNLGKNGLTGTLEMLTKAITDHMGPSGQVLMNAFNQSKAAAADAQAMIDKMPKSLQGLAKQFADGQISVNDWRKALKGLPVDQAALASQFATTETNAKAFNQQLRSGSPEAQTYNAALEKMLGGSTGLTTALMLTGDHMATFQQNVKTVGDAAKGAGSDVNGWDEIQGTLNQKLSQANGSMEALGISIGQKLLPVASQAVGMFADVAKWLSQHSTTALVLAGVIGGVLVTAISLWTLSTLKGFATSQAAMARDIVQGTIWLGQKIAQYSGAAAAATTQAAGAAGRWIYWNGVILADQISSGVRWLAARAAASAAAAAGAVTSAAKAAAAWAAGNAAIVADQLASGARWLAARIATYAAAAGSAVVSAATTAAAWIAANAAMLLATGGIVLAVGLLVAAGVWLYNHWDQVWSGIQEVAGTVWNWLDSNVFQPIGAAFRWLYETFVKPYIDLWILQFRLVQTVAMWLYDNGIKPALDGIGAAFSWLGDHVIGPFRDMFEAQIHAVGAALQWVYDNIIRPVADAIGNVIGGIMSAIHGVANAASGIGNAVGSVGHMLGFAEGGWVPGSPGQAQLAVVHGGEYVLSRDMIAGRVAPSADLQLATELADGAAAGGRTISAGGGAGAGGVTIVYAPQVQGSLIAERQLFADFQTWVLTYFQRNSTNGLSGGLA